jgi:hypothetical protein
VRKDITALMIVIAVTALSSRALASNVGFSFGINIGNVPAPMYAPQPVVIDAPPEFVAQPAMGLYVAVGTPYDLFYAADRYYLCRGNLWYAAPYYNGPWVQVGCRTLPRGLRRYPIDRIRNMRDEGGDYGHNGYRKFRPEWNDRRDRHARWEGERPYGVEHHRHARQWEGDDYD